MLEVSVVGKRVGLEFDETDDADELEVETTWVSLVFGRGVGSGWQAAIRITAKTDAASTIFFAFTYIPSLEIRLNESSNHIFVKTYFDYMLRLATTQNYING